MTYLCRLHWLSKWQNRKGLAAIRRHHYLPSCQFLLSGGVPVTSISNTQTHANMNEISWPVNVTFGSQPLITHCDFNDNFGGLSRVWSNNQLPSSGYNHHYCGVIMGGIASQITSLTIVYSQKTSKLRVTGLCTGNSPGSPRWIPRTNGQ